jgi:hypothetical protein
VSLIELLPAVLVLVSAALGLGADVAALLHKPTGATVRAHLRTWALVRDPERRTRLVWATRVLYAAVVVYLTRYGAPAPGVTP